MLLIFAWIIIYISRLATLLWLLFTVEGRQLEFNSKGLRYDVCNDMNQNVMAVVYLRYLKSTELTLVCPVDWHW